MRKEWLLLLLVPTLWLSACHDESTDEQATETEQTQPVVDVNSLPPAIEEPKPEDRTMQDYVLRSLEHVGLPFEMQLPESVDVEPYDAGEGWVLMNPQMDFKMYVVPTTQSAEELLAYWEGNPDEFQFGEVHIRMQQGALFSLGRRGFREYHIEYVTEAGGGWRIYSAKDRPFSRFQAERMMHACRTIQ